jgi:ribosomal protein L7Ae-like RNA K-turn-binding protein
VRLVIVARDASLNTKKHFTDMCKFREVEIRTFGNKEFIGRYMGKEIRSVVAVTEQSFAGRLIEMIDSFECEFGGGQIDKS